MDIGNIDTDTWVWIAVAVVAALALISLLAWFGRRKKRDWDEREARNIRGSVERRAPDLQKHDAEARQAEAKAEEVRAEADRLDAIARERRDRVDREREGFDERLRKADELDPRTDSEVHGRHR